MESALQTPQKLIVRVNELQVGDVLSNGVIFRTFRPNSGRCRVDVRYNTWRVATRIWSASTTLHIERAS